MIRIVLMISFSLFVISGCGKTPPPQPVAVAVPPGMTVEIYELDPTQDPSSLTAVHPETGKPIFLKTPPLIATSDVATIAEVVESPPLHSESPPLHSESATLQINLNPTGATNMATATATPSGQELAIVVNGVTVAVAQVRTQISDKMVIQGGNDTGEFQRQIGMLTGGK
ncbi:hypothetical protein DTL21_29085 [Bremerella cremea]|uniref:SecDF P1 head subdomain domain-containing protein n=1 Tax=Blastopirellula marina TaxID=124 RepID=A0A2S8F905_9BACT|nr:MULTISPECIES: hypothetical protein [Pirellulaceae]PQO28646.1 hypothetical protein C5Y83_29030 [Blastopirellula marina]RCS42018.1 hypothetical protein DTL21_29085 [Bremerella cremea]